MRLIRASSDQASPKTCTKYLYYAGVVESISADQQRAEPTSHNHLCEACRCSIQGNNTAS